MSSTVFAKVLPFETSYSEEVKVNQYQNNFKLTLLGIPTGGFDGEWTIELRLNDVWFPHDTAVGLLVTTVANVFFPVEGVRLRLDNASVGEARLIVAQGA